jgi:hypothetical protein
MINVAGVISKDYRYDSQLIAWCVAYEKDSRGLSKK